VGGDKFVIQSNGNLGIGTTGPGAKLDIRDTNSVRIDLRTTNDPNNYYARIEANYLDPHPFGLYAHSGEILGVYQFPHNPTFPGGIVGFGTTSQATLRSHGSNELWLHPSDTQTSSGLSIGTAYDYDRQIKIAYTPGTVGAGTGQLVIGQTTKNAANYTHGITSFYTNGSERVRIDSSGNVGIGTTGPGQKLEVIGDVLLTGNAVNRILRWSRTDLSQTGGGLMGWVLGSTGLTAFSNTAAGNDFSTVNTLLSLSHAGNVGIGGTAASTSPVLYAGASGNVGIGTTGPGQPLHVYSNTGGAYGIRIETGSNVGPQLQLFDAATTQHQWGLATGYDSYTDGVLLINDGTGGTTKVRMMVDGSGNMGLGGTITNSGFTGAGLVIKSGNVGIGTTGPTYLLSLGGNSARTFWMERHTTANTAGNTLTVQAGGATSGATDKAGGDLLLYPGVSTGSAESGIQLYGCVAGASGTADRTQTKAIQILGNKIGFWAATPTTQSTGWTISNKSVDTVLDCNATTLDELADVVGTLVDILKGYGLLGS
jgi:hypothetical protein